MIVKEQELKILDKIDADIRSAGNESYIHDTFGNIVEICKRNIINDFGDYPVRDLADLRKKYDAEIRAHDETKRQLADAQKALKEALDLNDKLRKTADEWEKNAHDASDLYAEMDAENARLELENRKLKAQIVRMKFDRMTEEQISELYGKVVSE